MKFSRRFSRQFKLWSLGMASALLLAGCGGGGDGSGGADAPAATPPLSGVAVPSTPGRVAGTVVASDTGLPLGSVQVQVAGKNLATDAEGSFSQDGVAGAQRVVLRFVRDGYADAFATTAVIGGATASVSARMVPVSARATVENSAGATVTDSTSAASVVLPPSGIVDAATGAAPQGLITVQLAAINPATNPANMPGDYTSSAGAAIESFGALSVQLRDAAGKPLNLAPGKNATIRIPLASRSGLPPQTIPLFYFNETTGLWVEEGTATLAGVAPRQYYEGRVAHFSVWNADQVLDTIFVNGCVAGVGNQSLSGVTVTGNGIDYSGFTFAVTDPQGKFRLPIRRNSRAGIGAAYPRLSTMVTAGPSATDMTLPACLPLSSDGEKLAPVFLITPGPMVAPVGTPALFIAMMANDDMLTYQWFRNGQVIDGATQSAYSLPAVSLADSQSQFTVKVTNAKGSVSSEPASLTVIDAVPPADLDKLFKMLFTSFEIADLAHDPLNLFEYNGTWLNPAAVCRSGTASGLLNGQPIPAGTEQSSANYGVSGMFAKCITSDNTSVELSGAATASFTANADFTVLGRTGRVENMRKITRMGDSIVADITGNGSEAATSTVVRVNGKVTSENISAPVPGSTVRNNLTGQVTRFISGDSLAGATEIIPDKLAMSFIEQRSSTFTIAGVRYVANGKLTFPAVLGDQLPATERLSLLQSAPATTGQLSLSRNGFQIGRIFADSDKVFVEINGVVKPMFGTVP